MMIKNTVLKESIGHILLSFSPLETKVMMEGQL